MSGHFIKELAEYELRPTAIERTKINGNDVVFYGFPLPSCKGEDDDKWLIQIYVCTPSFGMGRLMELSTGTLERTGFVNGVRDFTSRWSDRYDYSYYQSKDFPYPIFEHGYINTNEGYNSGDNYYGQPT